MDKALKMTNKHTIPFGKLDADGNVSLTRKEAEEAVKRFKATGDMPVEVEGHNGFKVIGAFIEYSVDNPEEGDVLISGEYQVDIHKKSDKV